jgi:hypothetical protein
MARKQRKGNGMGTVYPRRNTEGKIVSYLGQYIDRNYMVYGSNC